MRVAIVTPYDLDMQGGVQQHVTALAADLRRRGDEVLVLGPGTGSSPGRFDVGRPIPIPSNGSISRVALSPAAWSRTRSALRRFDPDVVHVHEPTVPVVAPAAVFGARAPVVATFHAWAASDVGYRALRPYTSALRRRITSSIAVSPAAAAFHGGALGVDPSTFEVIPNGVDVDRFRSADLHPDMAASPSVLFVGRLAPRKGVDVLIRAFPAISAAQPDTTLWVAGTGPERADLESLVPERLAERVRFLGRVSDEDLPRLYRTADVFVAPARGGESFGIVLVEAMAAGAAVVASDIPGYASVVTDGVDGRLVIADDPTRLAEVVGELLASPDRRSALSKAAQRTVDRYDWGSVTGRVRAVYERAIG